MIPGYECVRERIAIGRHELDLVRPRSAEALIDERDFDRDERLPYWAELWPSGRVLAQALAERRLEGRDVLELGCGIGLPAIVALLGGARVLATDWYPVALEFARLNAQRATGRPLETLVVDWREPPAALLARAPFDLVVGADLLYEARNGEALAALVPRLLGDGGEAIIADPRRPDAVHLLRPLAVAGWAHESVDVPVDARPDESGPIVRLHRLRPPWRAGPRP